MGRPRMMGAGSACSSLYDCNVNLKTCGGNKKQGLAVKVDGSIDFSHRFIKTKAIGNRRDVVFTMNQLGGVSSSAFSSSSHAYSIGGSVTRKDPFICSPYCTLYGIRTPAQPLVIPPMIETDPLIIPQLNIFQYSEFDGFAHCYTNATAFKNIEFLQVTIGGVPLTQYFSQYNITPQSILEQVGSTLDEEDFIYGTGNLLVDRVDGKLYSTSKTIGFKYGTSVCSKLYEAMKTYYPERVITCPTRQSILHSGDSFSFDVEILNIQTIRFNIQVI